MSSQTQSRWSLAAVMFGALVGASPAFAQDHTGPDHNQIMGARGDIHGNVDGYGAAGFGLRADIPIAPDGFIGGDVHDELALSPGVEVFFLDVAPGWYEGAPYLTPLTTLQWNFYVGERWSVFPEAGVAFYVGDHDAPPGVRPIYAAPAVGFGARYHMNPRNALLMRVSSPAGFQFGVTF